MLSTDTSSFLKDFWELYAWIFNLKIAQHFVEMNYITTILFLKHFRGARCLHPTKHILPSEEGRKVHKTAIKYLFFFSNRINFITVDLWPQKFVARYLIYQNSRTKSLHEQMYSKTYDLPERTDFLLFFQKT